MKTKNSAWLQLLDEVHRQMDSLGKAAAVSLILPGREGHDAPPLSDQQALQIAQSLLLLDWFHRQYAFLSRADVADWLESVSQPTCGFLIRSWNAQIQRKPLNGLLQRQEPSKAAMKSGFSMLDQRLRQLVRQATTELQSGRQGKNAARDVVELILELTDSAARRGRGVYFTPPELARFVVKQVNRVLLKQEEICRQADRVQYILDPAVGAGIFLVKVIECAYESFSAAEETECDVSAASSACGSLGADFVRPQPSLSVLQIPKDGRWSAYAAGCLLPRLVGCDVMLPSLLATHFNIAIALEETGFDFQRTPRLNLFLANCLADAEQFRTGASQAAENRFGETQAERDLAFAMLREAEVRVIIGNPPFYSMSENHGRWIQSLLRGECIASSPDLSEASGEILNHKQPSYFEIDGGPLRERKAWLHDDYVKFIRYAQWQIDRSGSGVLGFVTNRGFLDNITFRGMRYQLLQSFDHIEIFDLHGDARNQTARSSKAMANGERDENVFDIETGVAVTLFGKLVKTPAGRPVTSKSFAYESWQGSSRNKLRRLQAIDGERDLTTEMKSLHPCAETNEFKPAGPNYFFVARDIGLQREYETGFRLCDVMPRAWSAPVTARDHFLVAYDAAELEERLTTFRDLSISDDEVREKFFQRTRSAKYPPGDTRGWRLPAARRQIAADDHWRDCLRTCTYRPFDRRAVFWSNEMVDWPRPELERQLRIQGNLALIGRRQSPRDADYHFFFVADQLMLDGILRSDNRGNESIFPLYVERDQPPGDLVGTKEADKIAANYSVDFIQAIGQRWQLTWTSWPGDLTETIGPLDLFHYVYAMFHSAAYQQRYRDLLCVDFPRVFVCHSQVLAKQLITSGSRLVALHLLRDGQTERNFIGADSDAARTIAAGFPKYHDSTIYLNKTAHLPDVSQQVWQHQIGSHQVARKWLKDRRGRSLSDLELETYARIVAAIDNTIVICREIDRAVDAAGGWQKAFVFGTQEERVAK